MDTKKNQGRLPGLYFILLSFLLIGQTLSFARDNKPLGFFPLRSQSPIQQLRFGIQHHPPWTVPQGKWALQLQHTWKNIWLYSDEVFRFDGEVHETVPRVAYGLTDRLEFMAELPVRYLSGGILDGIIEGFHSTFGLTQAGRKRFPRDDFVVEAYVPDKGKISATSAKGWQIGNLVASVTYSLVSNPDKFRAIVTGNVKFPTASTKELFGSQKIDGGLSFGIGKTIKSSLHFYYNLGLLYFSDKKILGLELRQWHLSSLLAFEYHKLASKHSWILQGLIESGVARNYYEFSERTYELMFGYKHRYESGWVFEIGFLENLFYFDNSPDIALHVAVTKFLSSPNRLVQIRE